MAAASAATSASKKESIFLSRLFPLVFFAIGTFFFFLWSERDRWHRRVY